MPFRRSPALLGLAILPMLALAGCSASSPASPATHAAASTHASSSTSSRAKGTPITTGAQLCTLASVQEATTTLQTAKPFTSVYPQNTNDGPMCAYSGDSLTDPAVTVTLLGPKDGGMEDGRRTGLPLTPVPGLGQQAGVNDTELDVILDKAHWLEVDNNGSTPITHDRLIAFTKLVVSRY